MTVNKLESVTDNCELKAVYAPLKGLKIRVMGFSHYRVKLPYGMGGFNLTQEEFESLDIRHRRRCVWPD